MQVTKLDLSAMFLVFISFGGFFMQNDKKACCVVDCNNKHPHSFSHFVRVLYITWFLYMITVIYDSCCHPKPFTKSFFAFCAFIKRPAEGWDRKWGRERGNDMMCSKGPQGGIEPEVAAARTQPLYIGCLPCPLSLLLSLLTNAGKHFVNRNLIYLLY